MNRKYRKTVIAANWKMNKTPSETKAFLTEFKNKLPRSRISARPRNLGIIQITS